MYDVKERHFESNLKELRFLKNKRIMMIKQREKSQKIIFEKRRNDYNSENKTSIHKYRFTIMFFYFYSYSLLKTEENKNKESN